MQIPEIPDKETKMKTIISMAFIAGLAGLAVTGTHAASPENTLVLTLKCGPVHIEMFADKAPRHVAQIRKLARMGFYDGIIFHRVIPGFMAQTGDPTGTGYGGSKLADIKAEFNSVPFERGIAGMARSSDPDSANSQFFIMLAAKPHLNGQYTAWGRVTRGMECIDKINKGEPPANPDKIIKMRILADIK